VALDDFGTGYSSLSYLRRFPVDKIKIDQSFIAQLGKRPESSAIVKAIVDLAEALELKVLAEGVETAEQAERLARIGCSLYQGYFFSRPVAAARLGELIAAGSLLAA
jgi:EAL domain-containing protein (putative c-di-GMP-specific phosphodiesterase class I)